MPLTRPRPLPALAAAALALVLAAPALGAPASKTVEHSIPATGKVRIANLAGTVDLLPAGEGPIKVVAVVHAEGSSASETRELIEAMRWVQERDGTWNLSYPVDDYDAFTYLDDHHTFGGSSSTRFRGERVRVLGRPRLGFGGDAPVLFADITVHVPRGARLEMVNAVGPARGEGLVVTELKVDTGSGNVKLARIEGRLVADTGSGDVELSQITGDTLADTGSGTVRIEGIQADRLKADTGSGDVSISNGAVRELLADTGSGDIEVEEVRFETFKGDTGSGDVTVRGGLAGATHIAIDTGSGEVHLLGGEGFEFDLTADTGSGEVEVGYTDAELRGSRREITGARRGSGRTRVVVGTGSGDVVVRPINGR